MYARINVMQECKRWKSFVRNTQASKQEPLPAKWWSKKEKETEKESGREGITYMEEMYDGINEQQTMIPGNEKNVK